MTDFEKEAIKTPEFTFKDTNEVISETMLKQTSAEPITTQVIVSDDQVVNNNTGKKKIIIIVSAVLVFLIVLGSAFFVFREPIINIINEFFENTERFDTNIKAYFYEKKVLS